MADLLKTIVKRIYRFLTHRILWLFVLTAVLFTTLFIRLFALQIVDVDRWVITPPENVFIEIPLQPQRGTIYDRHGRPLAINHLAFVVKMDPSVPITNEALLELALLFERNGERFVDDFPILTPDTPDGDFAFNFTGANVERRAYRWKHDMAIPNHAEATAYESFTHLRRYFRIDPELCDEDARRILNFRCQIFMLRLIDFQHYRPVPITFAIDVSHATMAVISEQGNFYTGLFIDIQTRRDYPGGRYVSHIIGYVGLITAEQYAANRHLGYTQQDLFGRSGMENALELVHLRGVPGLQRIEVNRAGRRVGSPEVLVEPIPGDAVFLSVDLELQKAAYYILKDYLTRALIERLLLQPLSTERVAQDLSVQDALIAFVRNGSLNVREVLNAEPGNPAYAMRLYIIERAHNRSPSARGEGLTEIHGIIIEGLESGRVTPAKVLLTLIGTGQINDPEGLTATRLTARPQDALQVLIEKLRAWELTPQQFNLDPSTGSIVVLDVHTGGVLAAVSYPTFDNNNMVNVIDQEYLARLNTDPSRPMVYRAFMEARAPGSTFKMIPAIAALEYGTVGANTIITSTGNFSLNDVHVLNCWATWGHGRLNITQAIAVSCNVFFAESVFRLGNNFGHATRNAHDTIGILNGYMQYFGLHEHTGAELWEHYHAVRARGYTGLMMPSPELNRHVLSDSTAQWLDANNAQVAIGQDISNYTPAQMARVMLGLANRSEPYPLHFVRMVTGRQGQVLVDRRDTPEMPEPLMEISDAAWNTVIEGMRLVTEGNASGTALGVFRELPIQVAGKTGTAQEGRNRFDHSAFGAFAPLDDPQIAVYVNVPFSSAGANRMIPQLSARIARDTIGAALGTKHEPETPLQLNTIQP
ncbi:MAG: penicillin-binding transpeptidase domain-containing protein [Defluviitaleaceae bacterium]|nr:penicillin-binding transpeptidase domain-containing protein [Defluviitaleaceae bacterium]